MFGCGSEWGGLCLVVVVNGEDCVFCRENFSGRTALHSAAHTGHVSIVKLLLQSGADILAKVRCVCVCEREIACVFN